jgi:hypothetical protein
MRNNRRSWSRPSSPRGPFVLAALLLAIPLSACGGRDQQSQSQTLPETQVETTPETTSSTGAAAQPWEVFDRNRFAQSTTIDNEWFPLQPGTQFIYEGSSVEDGKRLPHRVVFTVTDLTKVIDGVRTVVVWDRDYTSGELVETELALFAQDDDGTVWHLGQYPEEYENGEFLDAPAWIAGFQNARPGISMKAKPEPGAPSYSQGWGPAVNWTDRAQVYRMGEKTCVPVDCYEDVLVMEEFSAEEPNAFQLKYYAPGVGNVRVGWKGDDPSRETLKLVKLVQLSAEALADVRAEALKLEKRAYTVSKDVYAQTSPAEGP